MKLALVAVCTLGLTAAWAQDPKKIAEAITAHDKNNPKALNPQCKLFTAAELSKYAGTALKGPENATGGCIWYAAKGEGDVMVTVVSANYHTEPKLAKGYKTLPDVGTKGSVCPEMGGWVARAIQGGNSIGASVSGPAASEANAVALLKEAMKRVK